MVLVRASVKLRGLKASYSTNNALVDSGARMTIVERRIAEYVGVEYTGRRVNFLSISGHEVRASEAIVSEMDIEGITIVSGEHQITLIMKIPYKNNLNSSSDSSNTVSAFTFTKSNKRVKRNNEIFLSNITPFPPLFSYPKNRIDNIKL